MFSDLVLSPYEIPPALKGTPGTRVGLLYSDGAQHQNVGVEFWANPTFSELDLGDEPPNAWDIVRFAMENAKTKAKTKSE